MKKRLLCVLIALTMLCGMVPFSALADVVIGTMGISYVQIDGLDMPIVGELPDREVELIEGSGYTVGAPENYANSFIDGIAWYDVTTDEYMAEGEVFAAGHEYYPIIGLQAKSGYQFVSASAITGKTNLCDTVTVGGFWETDDSKYISVCLGTMMEPWSTMPLHRSDISTKFCLAYNANGEQISSAVEGETVTVRGTPAALGQEFYGWIIEPKGMDVTHPTLTTMQFTMPAEPVTITASYADITLNTVRLFFDDPVAGNEVDFTFSNMDGNMFYPGYSCVTIEGFENLFFNGVAWWDDTDGRYLKPGDVYQADHVYQISAVIAANTGYVFDSRENLTVKMFPGGDCVVEDLNISGYDNSKYKFVTSGDITTVAPRLIEIQGGMAFDAAGDVIDQAMPGTVVTIVADDAPFGFQFDQWMIMGESEIDIEDINSATTTFTMPNCDVIIFSGYGEGPKVPVESIALSLLGYYMNADADCLQLNTSAPVNFVPNSVTGLDYIVLANDASTNNPTQTQVTGALRNTAKHWIAFAIEPEFGYSLANLTESSISASWAEEIRVMESREDYAMIFVRVTYPARVLGKNNVTMYNGTSYVNNTAVTSAVMNMVVRIEADEAPEGQVFSGWNVLSGNVQVADRYSPVTTFVMGSSAVEIEAVYSYPLTKITLTDLDAPVSGQLFDYTVDWDYMEYIFPDSILDGNHTLNGVTWTDVTDPMNPEDMTPDVSVAIAGRMYRVEILIGTTNGRVFSIGEDNMPEGITATLNGERCELTAVDNYESAHLLRVSYYVSAVPSIQWNVVLSDSIGVNFIMGLTADDVVTAEINGYVIPVVKTDNGDGNCKVSIRLSAAQMTDEITLLVNGTPLENTYSVRQYADYLLADEAYSSCHELVKAMLAYGGETQRYFGYNTENPADNGIYVTPAVPTGAVSQVPEGQINGVSYYGATLVYRDKIAVRFYFTGNVEDVVFAAGDKVITPVAKDGMYYVEVADINPQDLGADITVTVTSGTENLSVNYSPLSYMVRMYEKESTSNATKALVQALYAYYQAAVNYHAQ